MSYARQMLDTYSRTFNVDARLLAVSSRRPSAPSGGGWERLAWLPRHAVLPKAGGQ